MTMKLFVLALVMTVSIYVSFHIGESQGGELGMAYAREEAIQYEQEIAKRDDALIEANAAAREWMRVALGPWPEGTVVYECIVSD